MRKGKQLHLGREQRRQLLELESPIITNWNKAKPRTCSFRQQLPWHQVAMVLHHSQQDYVACAKKFSTPRLCDQIDTFGGPAGEDDLVCVRRANVISHSLPRVFVSFRRARAERVQSTMDIRVVVLVKVPKHVDHGARLLRSRSAIEINQRMPVRLLAKNWEIFTDRLPIEYASGNLVHLVICPTAPPHANYSKRVI